MGKYKAHTRYYNRDGKLVPGVTTILGVLNKPALVKWANNLGLQGIDSSKFVDDKAAIGTLAHHMIERFLLGQPPETDDYSRNQIAKANISFGKFMDWWLDNKPEIIIPEAKLVSEKLQVGGTCDLICKIKNKVTLVDFKTGKGIYPEMIFQVAAYKQMALEAGHRIKEVKILRIGRDDEEGFEIRHIAVTELQKGLKIFKHCRGIYELQRGDRESWKR